MRFFFCFLAIQAFAAFNLTWGVPALALDSNPPIGDTDSNATIAMDPLGNAVAVWSQTTGNGANEHIWAAVYNHLLRIWTGALLISNGGSSTNPQVAIDQKGNATLVWEEGFPTQIFSRTLSTEGVWTPDVTTPATPVFSSKNGQTLPQIGVDAEGDALVIWKELDQGKYQIHSASKLKGSSWINLGQISLGLQSATLTPSKALALNETGQAVAVWQEQGISDSEIHGSLYLDKEWSPPLLIAKEAGFSAENPSVGIDQIGDAVIVWHQNEKVFSKTLEKGILSATSLLVSDSAYPAARPQVGVDSNGNAVVVYERSNGAYKFISASTLSKESKTWMPAIDISGPSPFDALEVGHPAFSINTIGDGVAIWKESTGSHRVIQGAGYSLGTWSSIKTLSSPEGTAGSSVPAHDIAVALNNAGNILAIWPEDLRGTGSHQIKATVGAGLANVGPMPPFVDPVNVMRGIASGVQVVHRFPAHADFINILSWTSPGGVDHFNVYRGNLRSLIGVTKNPYFEDHQRTPKQKETYFITSVDRHGQESGPMTLIVTP